MIATKAVSRYSSWYYGWLYLKPPLWSGMLLFWEPNLFRRQFNPSFCFLGWTGQILPATSQKHILSGLDLHVLFFNFWLVYMFVEYCYFPRAWFIYLLLRNTLQSGPQNILLTSLELWARSNFLQHDLDFVRFFTTVFKYDLSFVFEVYRSWDWWSFYTNRFNSSCPQNSRISILGVLLRKLVLLSLD